MRKVLIPNWPYYIFEAMHLTPATTTYSDYVKIRYRLDTTTFSGVVVSRFAFLATNDLLIRDRGRKVTR